MGTSKAVQCNRQTHTQLNTHQTRHMYTQADMQTDT